MTPIVENGFMPGTIPAVGNNVKNGFGNTDQFQNIMNNLSSSKSDAFEKQDYQQPKDVMTADAGTKQPEVTSSVNENEAQKTAGSTDKDVKEVSDCTEGETQDKVQDAEEEILTKTADKLGISEDELVDILGQMGLTVMDLLDPENVSALVAKVMGDGDMMALVTDESLSDLVLELNDALKEIGADLADELGVEVQDLKDVLSDVQVISSKPVADEAAVIDESAVAYDGEEMPDVIPVDEAPETTEQNMPDNKESAMTDGNAGANANAETQTEDSSNQYNKASNVPEQTVVRHNHRLAEEGRPEVFQQTVYENPATQDVTLEAVRELMGSGQTEILRQVTEYIRQNVSAAITELQMQLNPENLGTVGLNVSTKEGVVTAQFTTQNEAVKAVMEAQVMVLKENLEQQGVKVEAIEVTVESHAFEQNLQQGDDSNEQMDREQEKLKKATRKIDLGEWTSAEDIASLDEAEQVTAEMMQADGNTMDYKV